MRFCSIPRRFRFEGTFFRTTALMNKDRTMKIIHEPPDDSRHDSEGERPDSGRTHRLLRLLQRCALQYLRSGEGCGLEATLSQQLRRTPFKRLSQTATGRI